MSDNVVGINSKRAPYAAIVVPDEILRILGKQDYRLLVQAEDESIDVVAANLQRQLMYAVAAMIDGVDI